MVFLELSRFSLMFQLLSGPIPQEAYSLEEYCFQKKEASE